ncbi:MAG: PDZ domain-containing protein, partial [Pseudomonadota bacterium]
MAGLTNHSMIKTARDAKVLARLSPSHAIATENKNLKPKMMLLGLFAAGILFAAMQLQAAENWYEKSYKPQNSGDLKSMQPNPDTKMYVSNHKEDDDISMLENGYDMMGSSGFTAGDVPAEQALQYAKTLKADTVLVYSKYGSAKTASSKIQMIKEAAKVGKEL